MQQKRNPWKHFHSWPKGPNWAWGSCGREERLHITTASHPTASEDALGVALRQELFNSGSGSTALQPILCIRLAQFAYGFPPNL
jgi:hypothetical protein